MGDKFERINITDAFRRKYNKYLRPEILSVFIFQTNDEVWLETYSETFIKENEWVKETAERLNLDFISEDVDEPMFDPNSSIEVNAMKFVGELSPYSLINTTDLFTEEASDIISRKFHIFGIDE